MYCESVFHLLEGGADLISVCDCSKFSVIHSHLELVFDRSGLTFVSLILACTSKPFYRYKNRPHMTFDDVGAPAEQEFDLHHDNTGALEYSTKLVSFCVFSYVCDLEIDKY
jgi:hypothetical protein